MDIVNFLDSFEKDIRKMDGEIITDAQPPRYWLSFGNYALNRIVSPSPFKGIPQGRMTCICGPSDSGKSFLTGNIVKGSQNSNASNIVVDSEGSLDDDYMAAIGVDVNSTKYKYSGITSMEQCSKIVSKFLNNYKSIYGDDPNAPPVVLTIDSLDQLDSASEQEQFKKGEVVGDQGQRSKQFKKMLRGFRNAIRNINVSIIVTSQVYTSQDKLDPEGKWKLNPAIRYSMDQIILVTKTKLKKKLSNGSTEVIGMKMKCQGFKTRFTKPHQEVIIEVPYDTGINVYSGLPEMLESMGIISKKGGWYTITETGEKFQEGNIEKYSEFLLEEVRKRDKSYVSVLLDEDIELEEVSEGENRTETKKKRMERSKSNE